MSHALHAIVYVSSATHLLTQTEIDHLLERARRRNAEAGVTGLLLYGDGNFMQYIEGPRDRLMPIYDLILADPLHRDVNELLSEPVADREFADWAMAFHPAMVPEFLRAPSYRLGTAAHGTRPIERLGPGHELLRSIWSQLQRGRH